MEWELRSLEYTLLYRVTSEYSTVISTDFLTMKPVFFISPRIVQITTTILFSRNVKLYQINEYMSIISANVILRSSRISRSVSFSLHTYRLDHELYVFHGRSGRTSENGEQTSGPERNTPRMRRAATADDGPASINRINVIWRSGWTGTKRPWWRPRLRAFRLRPLAIARIKTWKPSPSPRSRSSRPFLPAREKERDQDTLSPCSFRLYESTLSCRFRRAEVVCRWTVDNGRYSLDMALLSVFAAKEFRSDCECDTNRPIYFLEFIL